MSSGKLFNGRRLSLALESKGMSNTNFAEKMEINRSTVTRWIKESGNPPKSDSIFKMSDILGINVDWFFISNKKEPQSVEFFRSNVSTTKKARNVAKSNLFFASEIREILADFIEFPKLNLPQPLSVEEWHSLDEKMIIKLATQCRTLWNLDNSPINNLIHLAESNGIIVINNELGYDKMDGVSAWYNDKPYIYIANDKRVAVRSRFDLAHEIGHLIMHKHVPIEEYNQKEVYKKIEQQAHFFANELLYPTKMAKEELLPLSLERFIQIKKKWKISIQAILRKAKDIGYVSDEQYLSFYKAISYRKWRTKEPLDDTLPVEKPQLFSQVVEILLSEGGFSKFDFIDKVHLSPDNLENLLSLPKGTLTEVEEPKINLKLMK